MSTSGTAGTFTKSGQLVTSGVSSRRLTAWSWWQRDPLSKRELASTSALHSRKDLYELLASCGLPEFVAPTPAGPTDPGFSKAMRRPLRLLWVTLDDYAARSGQWFDEDQLDVFWAIG